MDRPGDLKQAGLVAAPCSAHPPSTDSMLLHTRLLFLRLLFANFPSLSSLASLPPRAKLTLLCLPILPCLLACTTLACMTTC